MDHPEKRKKSKKDKKRTKHKKHEKKRNHSSSEEDSSSSNEEWIENSVPKSADVHRDEWMNSNEFVPTFSNNELKSAKIKERKEERQLSSLDKPGQHERELNPYWKDGGRGLPATEEDSKKVLSCKLVGDGGVDWLRRAYKRVLDQAKEEGRTAEDVAAERWGSLDRLQALLKEAEEKAGCRDRHGSDRRFSGSSYSSKYGQRPERTFQRPTDAREKFEKTRENVRSFQKPREESDRSLRRPERTFQRPTDTREIFEKTRENVRSFQKPREENDDHSLRKSSYSSSERDRPRWQKPNFKHPSEPSSKHPEEKPIPQTTRLLESNKDEEQSTTSAVSQTTSKAKEAVSEPEKLTQKEMNELGAKIIKAELMGNIELAEKLRARLNAAKEVSPDDTNKSSSKKEQVVLLTQSNARGLVSPLVCESSSGSGTVSGSRRKTNKLETHRDGERVCYFRDDGKYTLKQMFEKEKLTTADDETALYLKLAGGKSRLTTDDDFTIDDALLNRQERSDTEERQSEKYRNRAIKEHRQMNQITEKCCFCLDSSRMQKHLIVSLGNKAYVSLPNCKSLDDGHCYIVPVAHVPAMTHLDEDVWEEVQAFRRRLTEMFKSQEKDVVFMETSLHLRRHPHVFLECVPLSVDLGSLAPMYFKKAILECDAEWAQNKRLVDLSKKDIRRSVPKGLPYFAVDFGMDGGFAHVVEDEQLFPDYFGREILGGMLDSEPRMWKNPPKETFKDQSQKVLEFEKMWKPFDTSSD